MFKTLLIGFSHLSWSKKLESFLSTFSYRLYNCYVNNHLDTMRSFREDRLKEFKDSHEFTNVPFIGYSKSDPFIPSSFDQPAKAYNKKELDIAIAFAKGFDSRTAEDKTRLTSE